MTTIQITKSLNSTKTWRILKFLFLFFIASLVIIDSISTVTSTISAEQTDSIAFDTTMANMDKLYTDANTKSNTTIIFCDEIIDSADLDFIKELIASTESQSNQFKPKDSTIYEKSWTRVNKTTDAAGRYQFLRGTRKSVAKRLNEPEPNFHEFLNDREMQDKYLIALLEANNEHFKQHVKLYKDGKVVAEYPFTAYEKFEGKVINGYYISKSGMILMSQAIGAQGTIDWLMKGCRPSKLPAGAPIADRRLSVNLF